MHDVIALEAATKTVPLLLPGEFMQLTGALAQYPQHKYLVAQIDYMQKELRGIKYSPTFAVFKQGRKVDQFFGAEPQQLQDHIWLHSDGT